MSREINIALADSLMAILGYKRIARQEGNIIAPAEFERCGDANCACHYIIPRREDFKQCDICGDYHDGDVPRECETGDGF
jgi:hypothetical protein